MAVSTIISLLFLSLTSFVIGGPIAERASSLPTAQIRNGTVQGVHSASYNQDFFLGIPFAQPPVGTLRFAQAASLTTGFSGGVYQANKYAPYCVGYGSDSDGKPQSEDCLSLNVVRPAGYEGQQLPVLVWIHASAFLSSGTADPRYNLTFIVAQSVAIGKPVIAVSMAYRLDIWGFIAADQVASEGALNIGLKDQRLALIWIQENIAGFGGDPTKVTIWGESSGGTSVGFHIFAYNGRDDGLFRAGIMQSGGTLNAESFKTPAQYQTQYNAILAATGCIIAFDQLGCLRQVPFPILNTAIIAQNQVVGNSFISNWMPVVDGDFAARLGSAQLADGSFIKVPVIIGCTSDEGSVFSPLGIYSPADFQKYLTDPSRGAIIPSSLVPAALAAYPDNDPAYWIPTYQDFGNQTPPFFIGNLEWRRSAAYWGDAIGIANRRFTNEIWAQNGIPSYSFRFDTIGVNTSDWIGATHFDDVSFVFDNTQGLGYSTNPYAGAPESFFQLSTLMSSTWASFAYDLDPNNFATRFPSAPAWPVYTLAQPQNIVWQANDSSLAYVEADTWRQAGIQFINENAAAYNR